jgi:hypothetical protein
MDEKTPSVGWRSGVRVPATACVANPRHNQRWRVACFIVLLTSLTLTYSSYYLIPP